MSREFEQFDMSMDTILHADPMAVKAAVEAEIRANTAARKAKGEHKRGRKKRKSKIPASRDSTDEQGA